MTDFEEFWWNNITGPHSVVTKTSELLSTKFAVLLLVPGDLPWRHTMRSAIDAEFKRRSSMMDILIRPIDVKDEYLQDIAPGQFILRNYASESVKNEYRVGSGMSMQEYIKRNSVLKNTILWLKGFNNAEQVKDWVNFCSDYATGAVVDGLFILEVQDNMRLPAHSSIPKINFSEYVDSYNLLLFCSFLLDEQKELTAQWKSYIAAMVSNLCETDAEVAERMILETNFMNEEPLDVLSRIAKEPDFVRRGEGAQHAFALLRNRNNLTLKKRLWSAQVQVLFPVIELERVELVRQWHAEIAAALAKHPEQRGYGNGSNEAIDDLCDIELGQLNHMIINHMLEIPAPEIRSRIALLRTCRNLLAHGECCSAAQTGKLLNAS